VCCRWHFIDWVSTFLLRCIIILREDDTEWKLCWLRNNPAMTIAHIILRLFILLHNEIGAISQGAKKAVLNLVCINETIDHHRKKWLIYIQTFSNAPFTWLWILTNKYICQSQNLLNIADPSPCEIVLCVCSRYRRRKWLSWCCITQSLVFVSWLGEESL